MRRGGEEERVIVCSAAAVAASGRDFNFDAMRVRSSGIGVVASL